MRRLRRSCLAALVAAMLIVPASAGARSSPGEVPEAIPWNAAAAEQPATEFRVALSQLLGEHAFLVMETMRAASLGQGEEVALRVALDNCTAQLRDAFAAVYGEAGGDGFATLWQDHIDLLLQYANAGRENDEAAMQEALRGLDQYVVDFSEFLAGANPEFNARDEAAALNLHVEQLIAFADGDYGRAYESQRHAFGHMFDLGDHLALGIARQFPDRFPDGAIAFSPRTDLRLTLDRLLGEHLVLAAETMRAGVSGAPDFDPGTAALDANTDDLAAAIGSVYGDDAGAAFADVWQAHIDAYVAYVAALGSGDEAARDASLAQLHAYHDRIAEFLSTANPHLDHEAVAGLIRQHVQALISQAEATEAGDHERAIATTREAYAGMFVVGAALADAIARQFPERFEDLEALPGTSVHVAHPPVERGLRDDVLLLLVLAAVASVLVVRGIARDGQPRR